MSPGALAQAEAGARAEEPARSEAPASPGAAAKTEASAQAEACEIPRAGGPAPLIVLMGVSGSGKSTVGERLAQRLGVGFVDGDDLHPPKNVAKMRQGHALTDDDRWPWLARVGQELTAHRAAGLVVVCSALKRSYRDAIVAVEPRALFVHLDASRELIFDRLGGRSGHFMPQSLLDSQFADLEPLGADEPGVVVDATPGVRDVVRAAVVGVRCLRG